jgi:hypothetical protein
MHMGHEGEWIRGEPAYPNWYGEVAGTPQTAWMAWDEERAADEADDDEWLDDESLDGESLDGEWPDGEWPDGDPPAGPGWPMGPGGRTGLGLGYGKGWGHGGVPGFSGWIAVAVAVVAAAAGVAAGFFLIRGIPVASVAEGATPGASVPASSGRGADPQTLPGRPGSASGNGSGNEQLRVLLTGRVLAVSGTSITIGGTGPSVTAAVTGATKITGRAHGIGGVKVGDEVAAELTGTPTHLVTTTLQDPAQ